MADTNLRQRQRSGELTLTEQLRAGLFQPEPCPSGGPRVGGSSPWGRIQHVEEIMPGLVHQVHTAGHGGIWVAPSLRQIIPDQFSGRKMFTGVDGWYEEDCDWCIPFLFIPGLIETARPDKEEQDRLLKMAQKTFKDWVEPKIKRKD